MRINLQCPFDEKDHAKALGARWDGLQRTWYVVDAPDLRPFAKWMKFSSASAGFIEPGTPQKPRKRSKTNNKARTAITAPAGNQNLIIGRMFVPDHTEYPHPPWEESDDWLAIRTLREMCS
jgi:hypothetical protein